jgi:CelD/BcsL family acetyltransferase involved in cellulose biosynthesis
MDLAETEQAPMKLLKMEITQTQIPTPTRPNWTRWLALAADRLKLVWRSVIWRSLSLVRRAGSKRKTLAVRETAALGDRRFVSVIQFERQRFLIGSSPSSVTMLAQLPDESASGEQAGEKP